MLVTYTPDQHKNLNKKSIEDLHLIYTKNAETPIEKLLYDYLTSRIKETNKKSGIEILTLYNDFFHQCCLFKNIVSINMYNIVWEAFAIEHDLPQKIIFCVDECHSFTDKPLSYIHFSSW